MKKALLIGVDHYSSIGQLSGCVKDATGLAQVLERHADGSTNFTTPRTLLSSSPDSPIEKSKIKVAARELFADKVDIALFYFAGHGYIEDTGGYLCGSDCSAYDDGFSLDELLTFAENSPATNKIIIADSCFSGAAGSRGGDNSKAIISDGMTILTASTEAQTSAESIDGSGGLFTNLLIDALSGAAANLVGDVTPGSVYAHIDQSLGPWQQRPVFKTNVKNFVSLRKAAPPITLTELQKLSILFPRSGWRFELDPSFEPERASQGPDEPSLPPPDPTNTRTFATLQRFARVNLVRPVDAPHMWHAAMNSTSCELTVLGEHYRNLVARGLL